VDIIYSIKKEAKRKKITISEIADKLGMSQESLSQMLKPNSIKFSVVRKIAQILNVGIDDLLGEQQASIQHNVHSPNSPQLTGDGNNEINYNTTAETIVENYKNSQKIIKKMQEQVDGLIEINRQLTEKLLK